MKIPYNLKPANLHRNASPAELYKLAILTEKDSELSDKGALIAYSGSKTGRSPKDKRVVKSPESEADVWWGDVNIPMDSPQFEVNKERALDYLGIQDTLYVLDAFAGWDTEHRLKVRVICSRPYHALFMHNMLISPTAEELENFGEPDFTIINAGKFPANGHTVGMSSKTSIDLNIEAKEMVILGTEYAGEMKKGVFTVMNYLMPKGGNLPMHCGATAAKDTEDSMVLFGLSGTGKTTLSADPDRRLIGDDEHVWTDTGIFNIEGGCYAKAIDLTEESEPEIFHALHFGAVLENVTIDDDHQVQFEDTSITQNTRGAYPIEFISNAKIPCVAGQPTDVVFLTCDAFGVLPPVAKLTAEQAAYHFISGYTAKVAGTEEGVSEPSATFSACFGAPFMVWHPGKYAELLSERIAQNNANVWLVNTGWTGGKYGVGSRIKLAYSRAIISAIADGALSGSKSETDPLFGFETVLECPGVPSEMLDPLGSWSDKSEYERTAKNLAGLFSENFKQFEAGVSAEILKAGPVQVRESAGVS